MKVIAIQAAILLAFVAAPRAEAGAILYSTTDLGTSTQLEKDASGHIYGLANASGVVYAFDKAPVTQINESSTLSNYDQQIFTLQNGPYKVGFLSGQVLDSGYYKWPTFEGPTLGWFLGANDYRSPVSDLNAQGQVVGTSLYASGQTDTYAAFSAPGLKNRGGNAPMFDNLNNSIAAIPGVSLTSAGLIDDQGRIVATGDNGHAYLLTPTALGEAATVPEPPTWMMLVMAGGLLGARSVLRGCRPGRIEVDGPGDRP